MAYAKIKTITEGSSLIVSGSPSTVYVEVWSQENIVANTSDVKVRIYEKNDDSYQSYDYNIPASLYIDGTHYTDSLSFTEGSQGTALLMWEETKTGIAHNTDGSKSISISAYLDTGTSAIGDITLNSTSVSLPTIPRGSILDTILDFVFENADGTGKAISVPCTKYSPSFYDVLTIKIGSNSIAERKNYITGQVTLTAQEISNAYNNMTANTNEFKFYLNTYSDSSCTEDKHIGDESYKTANGSLIPINPTFPASNITYEDTETRTLPLTDDDRQTIIKNFSKPKIIIGQYKKATANKGAGFNNNCYEFIVSGQTTQYANQTDSEPIEKFFNVVSNNGFKVSVKDNRGNITSRPKEYSKFIDYREPKIDSVILKRTDDIGTNTKLTFRGSIWVGNFGKTYNAIESIVYQYKETTASTYSTLNVSNIKTGLTYNSETGIFSNSEVNINGDMGTGGVDGFNKDKSYNIQIIVTDKVTSYTYNAVLYAGTPLLYGKKFKGTSEEFLGYGLGIGMKPTSRGLFVDYGVLASGGSNVSGSILNIIYPVGAIYMSVNNTNPAKLFGGTWVQLQGAFLLGAWGTTYTVNKAAASTYAAGDIDAGAATHTLSAAQLPAHTHTATTTSAGSHNHDIDYDADGAGGGIYATVHKAGYSSGDCNTSSAGAHTHAITVDNNTGGGGAHNNMPPYLVVYMWKRTA